MKMKVAWRDQKTLGGFLPALRTKPGLAGAQGLGNSAFPVWLVTNHPVCHRDQWHHSEQAHGHGSPLRALSLTIQPATTTRPSQPPFSLHPSGGCYTVRAPRLLHSQGRWPMTQRGRRWHQLQEMQPLPREEPGRGGWDQTTQHSLSARPREAVPGCAGPWALSRGNRWAFQGVAQAGGILVGFRPCPWSP